ncbi:MAG: M48 family metallopeptidase [Paludibacteraceae bacterium]|nr:M48 family metallopeptidase [Paludibacteraceae bacterium]
MKKKALDPSIPLEKQLRDQIHNALQGNFLESLIAELNTYSSDDFWRTQMEGHSFKVEENIMPRLFNIFTEVKKTLKFDGKVDFYITGDSTVNAFSVKSRKEGEPHIVNVNSALIELMTDNELRFVIGHEIGHLINQDSNMMNLIYFVFPPDTAVMPLMLQYKVRLWQQVSELVADRYGYLAIPDLKVCVSSFFKMTSGLNLSDENLDIDAYIKANLKHLDYFVNDKGMNLYDHPADPVRVHSLNLYATAESQEKLNEGMNDIITALLKLYTGEEGKYVAQFIASAGLLVAGSDEEITQEEIESILDSLSRFEVFPREYLEEIGKKKPKQIVKYCNEAMEYIMKTNPGLRDSMLVYLISIVIADNKFEEREVSLIYSIGTALGFQKREIAEAFAVQVQKQFIPSVDSIS